MNRPLALDRIRVVLSRTSHPGNIGAAARAMKVMGLHDLWLVAPAAFPDEVATARASGASDVLEAAHVVGSLQEALADTVFSAALTARRRELSLPRLQARDAALELVARSDDGRVALVFGNETSGLSNEEVGLCSLPVTIPTNPDFSSLNLGAAVQVLAYELRMAALGAAVLNAPGDQAEPATHADFEGFMAHLERVVTASGFHDPANPKRLLPRMRRLFNRVRLEKEEVAILRGMLTTFERPKRRG
ncbi:RNA methyltransferase [Thauera chlorobenzoica]|uniref:tRNA (cytidine/uridine-2'-O-)-methyltransferase TrmJ n=1 Tax=Thauera chlorobenzoica TaxID=96773 RepID=A0A1H5X5U1_9RHOO|nr:RNA methyltransferase [Thauera chlorobenzoica]APR05620.1 tRNA:Cm32/Um32 methyltransferase [Thauera chlorobenzoica]SEG07119.1 tRNA/rRNA methyltransferase [Thauera chlorobenzoica]